MGHLFDDERERIDRQGWAKKLGVAPYVRIRSEKGWVLNKRDDGACVFLDEHNRCKIHAEFGEEAKPLACRIFPFSVRPVPNGWQASLRFDCPSVIASDGRPINSHRAWVRKLASRLDRSPVQDDDTADLHPRVHATVEEIDTILRSFSRWLKNDHEMSMTDRLIGTARITTTLEGATLKNVRGPHLAELLDLLFGTLPGECANRPATPTARQRSMLRQLAFAHAEHVTLAQMRSGLAGRFHKRWQQLRSAKRFRKGTGLVPPLPGFDGETTFEIVESVEPRAEDKPDIENLLLRYLTARIEGRSVFGQGYYGWPVFRGLAALWLTVAVAGWLARYSAAVDSRTRLTFQDFGRALGIVDRAATRVPTLGTLAERVRVSYLLANDGLARLIHRYLPLSPV